MGDIQILSVKASGEHSPNFANNVIDSSFETRWSTNGKGSWIQLDLGSKKNVKSIGIAWHKGDTRQNFFEIQASNIENEDFRKVQDNKSRGVTNSLERYNLDGEGVDARYFRIVVNGNTVNNWASITWIEAFSEATTGEQPPIIDHRYGVDSFGIQKMFPDAPSLKHYNFNIDEDRERLDRHYGSCPGRGDRHEVISWEWEKSDREFVDQEVTGYFYLDEIESDRGKADCMKYERGGKGSGLAIKLRGSHHSNNGDDSAKCYILEFQYEGGNTNNFQKEYPHGSYDKTTIKNTRTVNKNNLRKWVGYKAITINKDNGVRCLAYLDYGSENEDERRGPDPVKQDWKLYYDVFDDGNLTDDFEDEREPPFRLHHGEKKTQFRMDRIVNPRAKFLSVREVSANAEPAVT